MTYEDQRQLIIDKLSDEICNGTDFYKKLRKLKTERTSLVMKHYNCNSTIAQEVIDYIFNNKPLPNLDLTPQQIELEKAKSIVANAKAREWLNQVHCPYCNSTNCKKISGISKATSVAIFGLFSQKVKKKWHCNNCKSDF